MSRRKLQWKNTIRRAGGDVNKVLPQGAKGQGEYLTKADLPNTPKPGQGEGKSCSLPIGTRKEQLVRQWSK